MAKHLKIIRGQLIPALLVLSLISCRDNQKPEHIAGSGNGDIIHARGFDVEVYDNHRILRVYNPWQGARNVLFTYILAGHDQDLPQQLPEGTVIRTPVRSVICLSTTHIALIGFIDETASVTAVSGNEYIFSPALRDRIVKKEISDIGYDMNLDFERILELNPDVILAYGVGSEAGSWLDRLRALGLKVVMIGEYLEDSPLAQAEWVKFVAHLFNKQNIATERFAAVEKEYLELAELAKDTGIRPVVMSGLPWSDSWFVPGGRSHFSTLIADAGGEYIWNNNRSRENFPVDIESVIDKGSQTDYWINTGTAFSKGDIENTDGRLTSLRPFKLDNLYNNNARLNSHGGNDYWESGIVNPHLILRDMIYILHPDLLPGHEPVYYRKL